jgi:hypothetical protein
MRGVNEFEAEARRSGKAPGAYMVCAGGYPREAAATFAQAAARASDLLRYEPDADLSIYEVETGIHFNVAGGPEPDDGFMPGVFDAFFDRVRQLR